MIRLSAIPILAASIWITGCARTLEPTPPPEAPVSSDNEVTMPSETEPGGVRGPVYVDSTDFLMLESFPVQVRLQVSGMLPTPCHALNWEVVDPDPEGRIEVALYSLADPELACIQVLEPFEVSIPLGAFESGSYTVYLNGEGVGQIEL